MAVLLSDDFNRADTAAGAVGNPQIGPAPTYPSAGMRVLSNQLATTTSGGMIAWNLGTPNIEVSAAATGLSTSGNTAQLRISEGGPEGSLTFSVNGSSYELYVGLTLIWSRSFSPSVSTAAIKMSYRDRVVRCYVDGILVTRMVLDYPVTGGTFAARLGTSFPKVDNILAVDSPVLDEYPLLTGGVPVQGFSSTAGTPTFLNAVSYRGRDTKTLDQAPGA